MSPIFELSASILDLRSHRKGKKVIVVEDIHSCYDELNQLLYIINWSPSNHTILLTGDLLIAGPRSKQPSFLLWLLPQYIHVCQIVNKNF